MDQIVVAALGRPFTVGMFYDARKDELVPGLAMWDSETLQKITRSRPQHSSEFHITASDSTEDKSFRLNVDASLKLSFLSGLIEVGGSANYLNDQKQLKNQSRVTLQYKATTHFEQLSLTSEDCEKIQNKEMIEKGLATHVVTGIEYGADAFFVFDSEKLEASQVQDVKGKMEAVIKKIPQFSIEGKVEIHLSEEEKALTNTFSCKFHGDFILQSNPATFVSAVQTYVDLPKLLGDKGENAVPVKVWMMPLTTFDTEAAQLIQGISVGLVIKAENTLDDLANLKMRCNDSLTCSTVGKFPQLYHQLSTYLKLCQYYSSELQRRMAEMCPAIREGKEDESALRSLFDDRDTSPFSHEKLSKWLDDKEREINVIKSCVKIMKGIPILSTQAEVDSFILSPGDDVRWGYTFTSLEKSDPFLEEMGRYLDALKLGKAYEQLHLYLESDEPWYYSNETVANMRKRAVNYYNDKETDTEFIAARYDKKYQGAGTYKYQSGMLLTSWGYPD